MNKGIDILSFDKKVEAVVVTREDGNLNVQLAYKSALFRAGSGILYDRLFFNADNGDVVEFQHVHPAQVYFLLYEGGTYWLIEPTDAEYDQVMLAFVPLGGKMIKSAEDTIRAFDAWLVYENDGGYVVSPCPMSASLIGDTLFVYVYEGLGGLRFFTGVTPRTIGLRAYILKDTTNGRNLAEYFLLVHGGQREFYAEEAYRQYQKERGEEG